MAADPDSFEDDCRSDDGTLSGEIADDSDDPEEVHSLLASIQTRSTQAEQRVHNAVSNGFLHLTVECISSFSDI